MPDTLKAEKSWREGIGTFIEPIIRLEAIPVDQLKGRVLAEPVPIGPGVFEVGKVIGKEDVEILRHHIEEAIVYSRPRAVVLFHNDLAVKGLNEICEQEGVLPIIEMFSEGGVNHGIEDNIGADIVLILPSNNVDAESYLMELERFNGKSVPVHESIVLVPIGPTPFIVMPPMGRLDDEGSDVLRNILGQLSRHRR